MDINSIILKSKKYIVFFAIVFLIIFFGYILLYFGYNESFYIENGLIQSIFQVITFVGDPKFFIIVIAIFYYGIDKNFGKNLIYVFLFSAFINIFIKSFIKDPRPSTNIRNGTEIERTFGFPSAHSQISVSFWGYIFYNFIKNIKKYIIQSICIIIIALVSISRVILGVHDIIEVLGGIIIGLFVLEIFILIKPYFNGFKEVPLIIKLPFFGLFSFVSWYSIVYFFPNCFNEIGQAGGILFAAAIFIPLEEKFVGYATDFFDLKKKVIISSLGLFLIFLLYFLMNYILQETTVVNYVSVFIEYIILGFFIFLIIPFLLKRAINHYF